jgi:DNA-binding transcriptional MerR regulator
MDQMPASDSRRGQSTKSASAFRTISEVSDELDVPQHVLRFWETKFSQIKPMKRGGGRRYYRPEDMALLRRIRELLYVDGYTIKGVQRLLRQSGVKAVLAGQEDGGAADSSSDETSGNLEATVISASSSVRHAGSQPQPGPAAETPVQQQAPGLDEPTRKALRAVLAELTELREMLPRNSG